MKCYFCQAETVPFTVVDTVQCFECPKNNNIHSVLFTIISKLKLEYIHLYANVEATELTYHARLCVNESVTVVDYYKTIYPVGHPKYNLKFNLLSENEIKDLMTVPGYPFTPANFMEKLQVYKAFV